MAKCYVCRASVVWALGFVFCVGVSHGAEVVGGEERLGGENALNTQAETVGRVSAADAVRLESGVQAPAGFRVGVFAAEPAVNQPIAFTLDDRGRLWVAENYSYQSRQPSVNEEVAHRDRIVVLEDVDGDGAFDKRKVFWDGGERVTSVEVGFGGVWVMASPYLLFIADANGDDVPDGEPVVLLDGFAGDAAGHNFANGLMWGPDGWLYGRHGITARSLVGKPGTAEADRVPLDCGVWRYHPSRGDVDVVAQGTTNPWGMDYDAYGQMFMINTVIEHLWHVVPGAYFKRMHSEHSRRNIYELMEQTGDHIHWAESESWSVTKKGMSSTTDEAGGGHAHSGLMIYQGDNWPAEWRGEVFAINLHGQRINQDHLERKGSNYVGRHRPDFMKFKDPWFRGLDMKYGPDGGVYVSDWSDIGECHEADGVHRTSGRIYKITYGAARKLERVDVAGMSNEALVGLLSHENKWFARHARRNLQERALAGRDVGAAVGRLLSMFQSADDDRLKLQAMWSLFAMGEADESWLLEQLGHGSEHVRLWAMRLLTDGAEGFVADDVVGDRIAAMAATEKSALVRLYLASAMGSLSSDARWVIAEGLARRAEDAGDRKLMLMTWYGIEPVITRDADRAAKLASGCVSNDLRRFITRRLADDVDVNPKGLERLLAEFRGEEDKAVDVLRGMTEALSGRRRVSKPAGWSDFEASLHGGEEGEVGELRRQLGALFGDGVALDELQKIARDNKASSQERRNAVEALLEAQPEGLEGVLFDVLKKRVAMEEVLRGLAKYDHADIPGEVLGQWGRYNRVQRRAALGTLVSRKAYAGALTKAIDEGALSVGDLSAYHAQQMEALGDAEIDGWLAGNWGALASTNAEKKAQIEAYRAKFSEEVLAGADFERGREVFTLTCGACHRLNGEGGVIGPDLTGSDRGNLDYLLLNIIDPNAILAEDQRAMVVTMRGGRGVLGVVMSETERVLVMGTATGIEKLDVWEVARRRVLRRSLMPENLLESLSDEDKRDLLGYLGRGR